MFAAPGEGTKTLLLQVLFRGSELPLEREKPTRGVSQRKRETKNSSPGEQGPFAVLGLGPSPVLSLWSQIGPNDAILELLRNP